MEHLRGMTLAVSGNWEYWLSHPERDRTHKDQEKYREQLRQRRELLCKDENKPLLDRLTQFTEHLCPDDGTPEFTLFHGCTYPCCRNSDNQLQPCECYLFPRDVNIVTRGLFGDPRHLGTPHFLFGHTHIPGFFTYSRTSMLTMWQFLTPDLIGRPHSYANPKQRFGINPGSAGIRGKSIPRTAVLLDTRDKTFMYLTDQEKDDYERTVF